jgi:hypothetical protein
MYPISFLPSFYSTMVFTSQFYNSGLFQSNTFISWATIDADINQLYCRIRQDRLCASGGDIPEDHIAEGLGTLPGETCGAACGTMHRPVGSNLLKPTRVANYRRPLEHQHSSPCAPKVGALSLEQGGAVQRVKTAVW